MSENYSDIERHSSHRKHKSRSKNIEKKHKRHNKRNIKIKYSTDESEISSSYEYDNNNEVAIAEDKQSVEEEIAEPTQKKMLPPRGPDGRFMKKNA